MQYRWKMKYNPVTFSCKSRARIRPIYSWMRKFARPYDRNVTYRKCIYESSKSTRWELNDLFTSSYTSDVRRKLRTRGGAHLKQGRVSVTLDSDLELKSSATAWLFDDTTMCFGCNTPTTLFKANITFINMMQWISRSLSSPHGEHQRRRVLIGDVD